MSESSKQKHIFQSLNALQHYIEVEKFKGYDPYDTLTSPLPFHLLGKWGPVIATQIQKRNPFNIRKLIGIEKAYNPKGLGLLLHGYAILQQKFPERSYKKQMEKIYNLIYDCKTEGYSGTCWGYNFGWASPVKYLKPYAPTVVVTAFIAKGLYEYYKLSNKQEVKELLLSIAPFILKDLPHTTTEDGVCISYSTAMPDCCYNASLLAAETLAIIYQLNPDDKYKQIALKAVQFAVRHQHSDGHWGYSINIKTAKERKQTDFHQGFVLESIWNISNLLNYSDETITGSLQLGIDFYVHKQFSKKGRSYWRLPSKYPTDIHHQAQGIITLTRMSKFSPAYALFAKTIAEWTIENMQDPEDGHFYFKKLRFYSNKISFMRWSQAWMFLALADLINPKTINMKRFLIYMGHPAHFHLFRNTISILREQGHVVEILIKKKDILEDLLRYNGWAYTNINPEGRGDSKIAIAWSLLKRDVEFYKVAKKFRPHVMIGTSAEITHIGKLLSIPSIVVNEDDAAIVPLFAKLAYPFATTILAPECCDCGKWEKKKTSYSSYHELAYLHPDNFTADINILRKYISEKNFFILRFAKLNAHHDSGRHGINTEIAKRLIDMLSLLGRVYITSERELEKEFEKYRIAINPLDIHHALAFADMYIGDSQTMSAEAAVLGTPSIRFNDFAGEIGYLEELEHRYGLTYAFHTSNSGKFFDKIEDLFTDTDLKSAWKGRQIQMLSEKINFADYMAEFFVNYSVKN